jgi:hypothetical protein
MAELGSLGGQEPVPGSFAAKAQTLLTRDWSKASWRSRVSIIQTVDWLLDLERAHRTLRSPTSPASTRHPEV